MEVIKILVSKKKNIEKLEKLTDDPAFIASLLKWKGFEKMPTGINIKIGQVYEKECGNTCENCGKPDTSTKLD